MKPTALALFAAVLLTLVFFLYWTVTGGGTPSVAPAAAGAGASPGKASAARAATSGAEQGSGPAIDTPARVEPSSARRGAAAATFEVVVTNLADEPVSDARISATRDGVSRTLGTTDVRGRFLVELEDRTDSWLRADHPRYQSATKALEGELPAVISLLLAPAGIVRGKVSVADGRRVPSGAIAILWDTKDPLPRRAWERAFSADDPRVRTASIGPGGIFEIPGLDPAAFYQVRVGAPGYAMFDESPIVTPNGARAELKIAPMYGLRVALRARGGQALATAPELSAQAGSSWTASDPSARPLRDRYRRIDLLLAGVDPDLVGSDATREPLIVMLSNRHKPTLDRVRFHCRVPGYEPLTADLSLLPVAAKPATKTLEMRPVALEWGNITVRFGNAPRGAPPVVRGGFGGPQLVLTSEDGQHDSIYFTSFEEPRTYRVPAGAYQARFSALNGMFKFPKGHEPLRFDVGARDAHVMIDLAGTGALAFDITNAAGLPFSGSAMVRVMGKNPPNMRILEVSGPPFVLIGLAPGPHVIEAIFGLEFPKPGESDYLVEVEIEARSVQRARMQQTARTEPE